MKGMRGPLLSCNLVYHPANTVQDCLPLSQLHQDGELAWWRRPLKIRPDKGWGTLSEQYHRTANHIRSGRRMFGLDVGIDNENHDCVLSKPL
jgi:hypothetical protein